MDGSDPGVSDVRARLERSDPDERLGAIAQLRGRVEPEALDALARGLTDPDADVRRAAFGAVVDLALRASRDPDLTAMLRLALSDVDPQVRIEALDALAERGEAGLAVIREATADPSVAVAAYARHLVSWAEAE